MTFMNDKLGIVQRMTEEEAGQSKVYRNMAAKLKIQKLYDGQKLYELGPENDG